MTTKWPDELIEACGEACMTEWNFKPYKHIIRTVLTTAQELGYATPVSWREAAAWELERASNQLWQEGQNATPQILREAASYLRQTDPAPREPVDYHDSPARDTQAPLSVADETQATPPAEAVTREEINEIQMQISDCRSDIDMLAERIAALTPDMEKTDG